MIRRYADGRVRFEGKNAELEGLAARAIIAERREFAERLHAQNMALLGETPEPNATREVTHTVGVESQEELWSAWGACCVFGERPLI
jgi:hypothetical protein